MMRQLKDNIALSPMESSVGILLIVIGAVFQVAPAPFGYAGYAVGILGSLLLSWGMTKAHVAARAVEELTGRLRPIAQSLGTVSGQISQAVREVRQGSLDKDAGLAVIHQSTTGLYDIMSELLTIAGGTYDPGAMVAIAARVDELITQLGTLRVETRPIESSQAAKIQEELESLRLQLQSFIPPRISKLDRTVVQETVSCAECESPVVIMIGTANGDSASPVCPQCNSRFHAHRRADGSVYSKSWGASSLVRVRAIQVSCPECKTPIPLTVTEGDTDSKMRYCLACYAKLTIDPVSEEVIKAESQEPLQGTLLEQATPQHVAQCPGCAHSHTCFYQRGDNYFAVCPVSDRLVIAKPATAEGGTTPVS